MSPSMFAFPDVWKVQNKYLDNVNEMELDISLVDSGVAVCMVADHVAQGLDPVLCREAIPGFRLNIVRNILCKNLE